MGLGLAAQPTPPAPREVPPEDTRTARLRAVSELVRLYEELERALEVPGDGELAQLVSTSRAGERALGRWANRLEALRNLKRYVEGGAPEPAPLDAEPPVDFSLRIPWTLPEPRALPLAWQAGAFLAGFAIALVCMAGFAIALVCM